MNADIKTLGGYKSINEFVEEKLKTYGNMEHSFETLYKMMFSETENIMYETSVGYEIKKITYGEVKNRIEKLSEILKGHLSGLKADAPVGLYMDNGLEWIEMFWSILRAGYSVVLMNLRLDRETLERTLADCGTGAVVSDGGNFSVTTVEAAALYKEAGLSYSGRKTSAQSEKQAAAGKTSAHSENQAAAGKTAAAAEQLPCGFGSTIYVMSSGTTANVKVCGYTGEEFYYQVSDSYGIIKKSPLIKKHYDGQLKQLTFLPFYHIFGLVAVYIWFAFFSRTFVELKNLEPETITGTIRKHGVTHIFAVPLFWEKVYEQAIKTIKGRGEKTWKKFLKGMSLVEKTAGFPALSAFLSRRFFKEVRANMFGESVSFMISGGSEIKPELLRFFNGIGYHLANGYGMSELGITSVCLDNAGKKLLGGFVGEPMKSVEYKLTAEGNLCVRGRTIASVVFENGHKRNVGRDEWFDTNDMAECSDGQYRILGRRDDVVISSTGENLNPNIIEQRFMLDGVCGACLIGAEKDGKKQPVLIISTDKFIRGMEYRELKERVLAETVTAGIGSELKDIVFTTDELLGSDDFKLNRRKIRAKYEAGGFTGIKNDGETGDGMMVTDDAMALKVREMVASAIDRETGEVGYESDFFIDLGGSSLDYFSMLCEIEEEFGISIPDETGTGLRSVRKICEYIKDRK